jgi:hypothetical protein
MADKKAMPDDVDVKDVPKIRTYVIDRVVYNKPGHRPLMPGDRRDYAHHEVAHLVAAGFMHADGDDASAVTTAGMQPLAKQPVTIRPAMPPAPPFDEANAPKGAAAPTLFEPNKESPAPGPGRG